MCSSNLGNGNNGSRRRVNPNFCIIPSLIDANPTLSQLRPDRVVIKNTNAPFRCNAPNVHQKQAIRQRLQDIGLSPQSMLTNVRNRQTTGRMLDIATKEGSVYLEGTPIPHTLLYTAHLRELYTHPNSSHLLFDFEIHLNVSRFIAYHGTNIADLLQLPIERLVTGNRRQEFRLRSDTFDNSDNYLSPEQYSDSTRFLEPLALFMDAAFYHFFREVARGGNITIRAVSAAHPDITYSPEEGLNTPHQSFGEMAVSMDSLVVNPLEVYADFTCENALYAMHHEVKPVFERIANDISLTRYRAAGHRNPVIDWEEREQNCITLRFPLHLQGLTMKAYAKQSNRIRFEITCNISIREISGQASPALTSMGRFLANNPALPHYDWPESVYAFRALIPLISEAITNIKQRFDRVMRSYRTIRNEMAEGSTAMVGEILILHRVIHAQRDFPQELRVRIIEMLLTTGSCDFAASDITQGGRYYRAVQAIEQANIWRTVAYAERRSRHSYSLTEPYQRMRERLNLL